MIGIMVCMEALVLVVVCQRKWGPGEGGGVTDTQY
jgi:hypothetical protein